MGQFEIDACKFVITLGTKEEGHAKAGDQADSHVDKKLDDFSHGVYRALVARPIVLSLDRSDVSFALKESARAMGSSTRGDLERLKSLAWYVKGRLRIIKRFAWQLPSSTHSIVTDAG